MADKTKNLVSRIVKIDAVFNRLQFCHARGGKHFEIRARHDGSSVTKLSQPRGFLYGWIPTVKKCHSISD
jgi:hypothetical protein